MSGLLLPVGSRRMSSWVTHQRRSPRSTEPGTDWYCPIGTPVVAPADGRIYGSGSSITPATGLWVGIEFDNGMSFRTMHHSQNVRTSGRIRAGEVYALSGATGYGEWDWSWNPDTGGAHVHGTLWPTWTRRFGYQSNGQPWTVDFMNYVGGSAAGGNANNFGGFLMALSDDEQRELLAGVRNIYAGLYVGGPATPGARPLSNVIGDIAANVSPIFRDGGLVSLRQEVADAKTGVMQLLGRPAVEVDADDAASIAAAIAPLLGRDPVTVVSALSDEDVARVAEAVADVQARRLAG